MEFCAQETVPRLREALLQLTNEAIIFERLMYKNVNQHRRALYFRRLCKVRRDLRLLKSTKAGQLIQNIMQFPAEKILRKPSTKEDRHHRRDMQLEILRMRRHLHGVLRLLDQMYDPLSNASLQIAGLLGQTFFMPFALATLSMLARIRALAQQCVQDITTIYNSFSKWASQNQLIDHNLQALPISLTTKWDETKLSMVPALTHHQPESAADQGFVEDIHGRRYLILENLPLGVASSSLSAEAEAAPSEDLIQNVQPTTPSSVINNTKLARPGLSVLIVEEAKHNSGSAPKSNAPSPNIEKFNHTANPPSPMLNKQPAPRCSQPRNPLSERNPKARHEFVPVPKKVAYVSVLSPSNIEAGKKEENPPLKKQKQDCLFDLLIGLRDDSYRSIF